MNVHSFVSNFNVAAFVTAFNSLEKNARHVTGAIIEAHAAGKAGLAAIMGAVAKLELTKPKINVLRVACFRARKLHNPEFTLSINSRARSVEIVRSDSIKRAAGAGRKPRKAAKIGKSVSAADNTRAVNLAHEQRDAALASAKYLAAAFAAIGMPPDRIAAIGKGQVKASTVRAWALEAIQSPIQTGKRARRAAKRAA
jgi:hypothetical protein